MGNMIVTKPFIEEVKKMRKAMVENLIDLMKRHGVSEVDCSAVNACPPVIHVGLNTDEDVYSLDTIIFVSRGDYKYILLDGHSGVCNGAVNASQMDIEFLVEVHNWVMDYEDELFEPIKK